LIFPTILPLPGRGRHYDLSELWKLLAQKHCSISQVTKNLSKTTARTSKYTYWMVTVSYIVLDVSVLNILPCDK